MWQLMQTARMLEAEWRQVVQGSMNTGTKEDESSTGHVSAGLLDFTMLQPFTLGARFETYEPFISLIFKKNFRAAVNCGQLKPGILNQWMEGHTCN
jgi:hypothetical protein